MKYQPLFIEDFCSTFLKADSALDALTQIATLGYENNLVAQSWLAAVTQREQDFPTGLPTAVPVAIPHTDSIHVKQDGIGYFRLTQPVEFGEMGSLENKIKVSVIIPLLITNPKDQTSLLMSVIALVQDFEFMNQLILLDSKTQVANFLNEKLKN